MLNFFCFKFSFVLDMDLDEKHLGELISKNTFESQILKVCSPSLILKLHFRIFDTTIIFVAPPGGVFVSTLNHCSFSFTFKLFLGILMDYAYNATDVDFNAFIFY